MSKARRDPEAAALEDCVIALKKEHIVRGGKRGWKRSLQRNEINRVLDYLRVRFCS